jgi:hypothetical protein
LRIPAPQVTYDIIVNSDSDPTSLDRIRYRICALSNDIILMEEILVSGGKLCM